MRELNLQKVLGSFNADVVKLQPKLNPKSVVADNTAYRATTFATLPEPQLNALLSIKSEEAPKNVSNEPVTDVELPSKYSGLKEFYGSLTKSEITNPKARAAIMAQMGLESGWGKKSAGSKYYNYGNIITGSSWKGDWFHGGDEDAKGNKITQKFRKYNSPDEFFDDYSSLLKRNYPEAYKELTSDDFDVDRFSHGLRNGRVGMYAESPTYETQLKKVYGSVVNSMYPEEPESFKMGGILYNH